MSRRLYYLWLIGFSFTVGLPLAQGQVTFLGPSPYLSIADSPFDPLGQGADFYFEDFEDGSFDLPFGVTTLPYALHVPSPTTDSVDADDGSIDGSGTGGYSLRPDFVIVAPSFPPIWHQYFELTFNEAQLGFLPNAFGFVWTDGPARAPPGELFPRVQVFVYDEMGVVPSAALLLPSEMDYDSFGGTAEDRFVGVTTSGLISRITVTNVFEGFNFVDHFEIDHIQFGVWVPEPSVGLGFVLGACVFLALRNRLRKDGRWTGFHHLE